MGQSPGAELCNTDGKGLPFLQGCAEFGASNPQASVFCAPPLRTAKAGSVLISVRAPVGTMNYADQDYCIGRGLGAFKAKPGLSNTIFLKHAVEHGSGYLHRRSQGSTFAAVSTGDVQTIPIPVFAYTKQNKIAAIFMGIDTAIEKTEALIAKYQQIKAGLMRDLFTRGVLPNGQLRPSRNEAPELYQETAIGWIPRDWSVCLLNEKVNPARPIVYGILMPGYGCPGGVPVVKVKDIRDRSIDVDRLLLTSPVIDQEYKRSRLKAGDVLFTIRGTVGRMAIVPSQLENANITQDTARIDLLGVQSTFISFYFETAPARRFFEINTLGVAVQGINLGELRKLPIPVPSVDEQAWISDRLVVALNRLDTEIRTRNKLASQKLGLMQDLLTGKIPVKVDVPEAADA
jgi:type I restriction enzyme S subunit